jgi:hypothetical protein
MCRREHGAIGSKNYCRKWHTRIQSYRLANILIAGTFVKSFSLTEDGVLSEFELCNIHLQSRRTSCMYLLQCEISASSRDLKWHFTSTKEPGKDIEAGDVSLRPADTLLGDV